MSCSRCSIEFNASCQLNRDAEAQGDEMFRTKQIQCCNVLVGQLDRTWSSARLRPHGIRLLMMISSLQM